MKTLVRNIQNKNNFQIFDNYKQDFANIRANYLYAQKVSCLKLGIMLWFVEMIYYMIKTIVLSLVMQFLLWFVL